jgi:hypothetical protein
MVDGASGVGTYFGDRTGIEALGHNGLFHMSAWLLVRLESLSTSRLLFRQMDFNIPAARQDCGIRRRSIGALDLEQLRFLLCRLPDMRFNLERKTDRIGALCGIWANCKSFPLVPRRRAICEATRRPGEG